MRPSSLVVAVAFAASCTSAGTTDPLTGPDRLSNTGLYRDPSARALDDKIIAFAPRYPLWSDGADKQRYLLLPKGKTIDTSNPDNWRFPIGTKLWKEFRLGDRLVETRFLEKRRDPDDGGWFRMAYVWLDDGSDAIAAPDGVESIAGTTYQIPSQRDCSRCHYKGEKPVIGLSAIQLSTSADPNQPAAIEALVSAGALSDPTTTPYAPPGEGIVKDALGYLHGNCGHCHNSESAAAAEVKVFMNLHVNDATPADTNVYKTLVGQPIHHFPDVGLAGLVVPGDPDKSLVYYRIARRDDAQMPPLGTNVIDPIGLATIRDWILSL